MIAKFVLLNDRELIRVGDEWYRTLKGTWVRVLEERIGTAYYIDQPPMRRRNAP